MKIDPTPYLEAAFGGDFSGKTPEEMARTSNWQFVRSNSQLASYELDLNADATGHIMTAWEAYDTFGPDILAQAMEYGSAVIVSERHAIETSLRRWREALGLLPHHVVGNSGLSEDEIHKAESNANVLPIQTLERIAFSLGLDERKLAYDSTAGADLELAAKLSELASDPLVDGDSLPRRTIVSLTEAASLIRVQSRLQKYLGLSARLHGAPITPSYGIGTGSQPWMTGYRLAERVRTWLGLEDGPILSLHNIVEESLKIPVVRTKLQTSIAGVTISMKDDDGQQCRGIVLNAEGRLNNDVGIQRISLAHQLAHLLFDSDDHLGKVRIDTYNTNECNPEEPLFKDSVEQRAAAFAIEFLAPREQVRPHVPRVLAETSDPEGVASDHLTGVTDVSGISDLHSFSSRVSIAGDSVAEIMRLFGISREAAQHQLFNSLGRRFEMPADEEIPAVRPFDLWSGFEEIPLDSFPIESTPIQRQGRFAGLIVAGYDRMLLSEQTAAAYLSCEVGELKDAAEGIRHMYPLADHTGRN